MRAAVSWLVLLAVIVASLAVAYGAYGLADDAWSGVVDYKAPYTRLDLPASEETSPSSQQVILVIIDGLRLDASYEMSTLQALRGYGVDLTLTTQEPSLSYPTWTTILSGTSQDYHGVVTNWHEGAAPVETLLDTAERAGVSYAVVGPSDIATLYPAAMRADASFFREWDDKYLTDTYVDQTIRIVEREKPRLVVLHLPDIDEVGHDFGGASQQYSDMVGRVDYDLRRLVEELQGDSTFVVVSDHGHTDTGGHGGWEEVVRRVPCVIAGQGVRSSSGEGSQEDVAPTVALLAGIGVPRFSTGVVYAPALEQNSDTALASARAQRRRAISAFATLIREPISSEDVEIAPGASNDDMDLALTSARAERLTHDRAKRRFGLGLWLTLGALAAVAALAVASWRALLASLWGALAYYGVYSGLFFLVHKGSWSLSAFNSEDMIDAWMNARLAEAAVAGLLAVIVAGLIFPLLTREPRGPRGKALAEWLAVGPMTVLVTQLTLALQVAWFVWAWGVMPEWALPDLRLGFKFDLDLVQMTALGASALLAPVFVFVVGRFHPRTR